MRNIDFGNLKHPALYDCSLKETVIMVWRERIRREVCEGKDGNVGHYEESKKYGVSATVCAVFYCNDFFTTDI